MIRALAKETDGDFTKFVTTTRKPRDMAQKWRAFKNIARFYKNPFAYIFWKTEPFIAQNRVRIMWVLLIMHLYQSFLLWFIIKNSNHIILLIEVRKGANDRTLAVFNR